MSGTTLKRIRALLPGFPAICAGLCVTAVAAVLACGAFQRWSKIRGMMEQLESPDPGKRASAAKELGIKRVRRAAPLLGRCLTDRDPKVRSRAAKALWRIRRDSGDKRDYLWHVVSLSDRLTVLPSGKVGLTRRIRVQISVTYDPVKKVGFLLPAGDLHVRYASDGDGRPLHFETDWDYPQPELEVSGISPATSGSTREVVVDLDLEGVVFREPGGDGMARLVYKPGFQNVPLWKYDLEIQLPSGAELSRRPRRALLEARPGEDGGLPSLGWSGESLSRVEQRALRFEATFPAESLTGARAEMVADRPPRDLAVALSVLFALCLAGAAYLFVMRQIHPARFHVHVLAVASLLGLVALFQPDLIEDNLAYYSYARSPLLDGDFNFYDDFLLHNPNRLYFYRVHEVPSPTGPPWISTAPGTPEALTSSQLAATQALIASR